MTLIHIPADSPFFAGHFPGHPILPGVAHLALIAEALGGVSILEIPSLRLRSPVRPGDALAVKIDGPADGIVRFELSRQNEQENAAVSSGTIRLGPSGPLPELPAIPEASGEYSSSEYPSSEYPPVETLVPHVPPARLVQSILEVTPQELTGVAEIPGASPFAAGGQAPAFLGLEAAAQGAALLEALGRRGEAPAAGPRIGYLVALRGARCAVSALPVDRPFRFTVRLDGSAPPLSIYAVTVEGAGGTELLRGSISTYIPPGS
jgi:3-hydroxyacyl-[acyl-carrier-protein] dehydratase